MMTVIAGTIGIVGAIGIGWFWFTPAGIPDRLEYLLAGIETQVAQMAQAQPPRAPDGSMQFDFSDPYGPGHMPGAEPETDEPINATN